ncbi:hypothetical protein FOZ60_011901 [Perkinsus olseni]|uniref:Uncharacterized protein n=1 Tax=Perkinsus olseni TaxID=32597 RepID=A0A7J6NDR2_PEROL|nr:hypothetical protein FOZ60_011901 [Perkinsus olseni]
MRDSSSSISPFKGVDAVLLEDNVDEIIKWVNDDYDGWTLTTWSKSVQDDAPEALQNGADCGTDRRTAEFLNLPFLFIHFPDERRGGSGNRSGPYGGRRDPMEEQIDQYQFELIPT